MLPLPVSLTPRSSPKLCFGFIADTSRRRAGLGVRALCSAVPALTCGARQMGRLNSLFYGRKSLAWLVGSILIL